MKDLHQTTFGAIYLRRSLKTRVTIFTLAIFVIGIWSLTFYAGRMLHGDMQRLLGDQQFSTVALIATEINQDLDERLRALENIAEAITPAMMGNKAALQAFLEDRPVFQTLFNNGVFVTRSDGTAIADVPHSTGRLGLNWMDRDHIAAALKEGKATIGRPVMGRAVQAPIIGMTAPIHDPQGKVIGALIGSTDLGKPNFLDRIAGNKYGKTGGYLIVAPQHRLIVTATDKSRIMEASPAPGRFPLIDRFMQGYEGTGILVNPLGAEVLQSAKGIPVAGWYVAAQLPVDEAFAPLKDMRRRMLLAAIFLTLLAGGLTRWMLRRLLSPMLAAAKTLAALSDANQPPQPLPVTRHDEVGELIGGFNRMMETLGKREEALRESEERYRDLVENANDLVYRMDSTGNIAYVNPSGLRITGYKQEELIGKDYSTLIRLDMRGDAIKFFGRQFVKRIDSTYSEFPILTKEGDEVWLGQNTELIVKDGQVIGFQAVSRDITERRNTEKKLQDTLESLRNAIGTTIQVLASAVESRDPYTAGHQTRSANLARTIAVEMGLPQDKIEGIRMAGSIHDIGKLSIPAEILSKPTKLSEIEFALIKAHSQRGFEMLKDVKSPWPLAEIVYQHHERMDGSGYPRNLKGEEILIEARILSVADVVEAMASHRPYRPGLGTDAALSEIEKNRGLFYDDAVADACLRLFREKGFKLAET